VAAARQILDEDGLQPVGLRATARRVGVSSTAATGPKTLSRPWNGSATQWAKRDSRCTDALQRKRSINYRPMTPTLENPARVSPCPSGTHAERRDRTGGGEEVVDRRTLSRSVSPRAVAVRMLFHIEKIGKNIYCVRRAAGPHILARQFSLRAPSTRSEPSTTQLIVSVRVKAWPHRYACFASHLSITKRSLSWKTTA
jgi:hypothetical protein